MTFKILHNLDPNSLSKLFTDFSRGFHSSSPYCSSAAFPIYNADLGFSVTGCKLVAQLPSPACRRVLFYLCVLWWCVFFLNEPTFKNLEIHIIHIVAFLEKSHNLATWGFVLTRQQLFLWGVSFWMKCLSCGVKSLLLAVSLILRLHQLHLSNRLYWFSNSKEAFLATCFLPTQAKVRPEELHIVKDIEGCLPLYR